MGTQRGDLSHEPSLTRYNPEILCFCQTQPNSSFSWAELALFSLSPAYGVHNIAYRLHNISNGLHTIAYGLHNIAFPGKVTTIVC